MIMKKFTLFFIIAAVSLTMTACGELADLNKAIDSDNGSNQGTSSGGNTTTTPGDNGNDSSGTSPEDNTTSRPGGGSEEGDNGTVTPPTPPTPPVDPYPCLTEAELDSGLAAPNKNIIVYPLVRVYGAEAPAGRYQATTSSGFHPTGSEYVDTIQIQTVADPSSLNKFTVYPNNYVTVKNGKETLDTGYLKSDNLKVDYNPRVALKFSPSFDVSYKGVSGLVRDPLNCSSASCKNTQIPAVPRLDTSKTYYAKITYDLKWEELYPDLLPGDYSLSPAPRFECFVEKK